MQIISFNNAEKLPISLDARLMYKSTKNEIILLTIPSGETLPHHKNVLPVTFFIIKGKGKVTVNNETFLVEEGDCFHIEPNKDREWINNSNEVLRILVIKELNI